MYYKTKTSYFLILMTGHDGNVLRNNVVSLTGCAPMRTSVELT